LKKTGEEDGVVLLDLDGSGGGFKSEEDVIVGGGGAGLDLKMDMKMDVDVESPLSFADSGKSVGGAKDVDVDADAGFEMQDVVGGGADVVVPILSPARKGRPEADGVSVEEFPVLGEEFGNGEEEEEEGLMKGARVTERTQSCWDSDEEDEAEEDAVGGAQEMRPLVKAGC
jgi:hypothetical protein